MKEVLYILQGKHQFITTPMTLKNIKLKLGIGKCDRPKSIYAPNIIHMVISISYIASQKQN